MAIKLSKENEAGMSAEYWRIMPSMSIDVVAQTVSAAVLLYASATARTAGKAPMHPSNFDTNAPTSVTLSGTDAMTAIETGDPRPALYAALKALAYFSSCEDV